MNKKYMIPGKAVAAIGARIREVREEEGLTMQKFGKIIGKHETWVCRVERGRTLFSVSSLILLCQKFDLNAEWVLFGGE